MSVSGMKQEWVAEVHVTGLAGGQRESPFVDVWQPLVHITEEHPSSGRGQRSRYVQMRSNPDPRGCIVLAHVGEQNSIIAIGHRADVHPVLLVARSCRR